MDFFRKVWGSGDPDPAESDQQDGSKDKDAKDKDKDTKDEIQTPTAAPVEGSMGSLLWSVLSSKLGSDVVSSGISLPAWMYEPLTILQRTAEALEHHAVLDAAAQQKERATRLAYVVAFAISIYGSTSDQRGKTNFNPILGETFEFVDSASGVRFFSEQVSHHPPVSAMHVHGARWQFWQNSSPTTKFLGNSLDVNTRGRSHVYLPATQEHIAFSNPVTRVHNIILGKLWYEHYGELQVTHAASGTKCVVQFKKAGLFQGAQHDIEGYVRDDKGDKIVKVTGAWHSHISIEWLKDCQDGKKGEKREVLRFAPKWVEPYFMPAFSTRLNLVDEKQRHYLLPSDSRRRPDRANLERGDAEKATTWKKRLEEQQRSERKARLASASASEPATSTSSSSNAQGAQGQGQGAGVPQWTPQWFQRVDQCSAEQKAHWQVPQDALDEQDLWVYVGDYWEQRDQALKALEVNGGTTKAVTRADYYVEGEASARPLRPRAIKGTAADFMQYELEESDPEKEHSDEPRTAKTDTSASVSEVSSSNKSAVKDKGSKSLSKSGASKKDKDNKDSSKAKDKDKSNNSSFTTAGREDEAASGGGGRGDVSSRSREDSSLEQSKGERSEEQSHERHKSSNSLSASSSGRSKKKH